jgi:hypothetical protein
VLARLCDEVSQADTAEAKVLVAAFKTHDEKVYFPSPWLRDGGEFRKDLDPMPDLERVLDSLRQVRLVGPASVFGDPSPTGVGLAFAYMSKEMAARIRQFIK